MFAGWRFDSGPKSYKGVCYVLDYDAINNKPQGIRLHWAVPLEEVYVPDGPPVIPLKAAADRALSLFTEPSPEDINPLRSHSLSFQEIARAGERHEYITLDRIIKYGPSPSSRACENVKGKHTPACRARFDGLIKLTKLMHQNPLPKPEVLHLQHQPQNFQLLRHPGPEFKFDAPEAPIILMSFRLVLVSARRDGGQSVSCQGGCRTFVG